MPISSRGSKFGSREASTGRSRRRLEQKEWIVEIGALSNSPRAWLRDSASSGGESGRAFSMASRSRTFSSPAAFSVKVMATISSRGARRVRSKDKIRSTRRVVLPVPAPASTERDRSRSFRAISRSASSARDFLECISFLIRTL
jgi:hypothetical protein